MATRSWVHAHYWPKRAGAANYRFCRHCWPDEDSQPSVEKIRVLLEAGFNPGGAFVGCVANKESPGNLINHMRSKHPEELPQDVSATRKAVTDTAGELSFKLDEVLLREWAVRICLGSLSPTRMIDDPNVRSVLERRLKGLAHATRLQQEITAALKDIHQEVLTKLKTAKDSGSKFTIMADTWTTKTKRRSSYCCIYLCLGLLKKISFGACSSSVRLK